MFKDLLKLNKALDSLDVHKKHVVAVMVIDKERSKILLGKRKSDGIWTSPAGHMQGEESARQCIIREAFEESNLKLKVTDLKDLPAVPLKKGRLCHVFLTYVDSESCDIHTKNDPDGELSKWEWFDLNGKMPTPMDEPRIISVNNARMKAMGLKKSMLANPDAGIDLNTAEQSQDEMAAGPNEWVERIIECMRGSEYGSEPRELMLPKHLKMYLSKVDDGIYSGIVKKEDPQAGDNGEVQTQFTTMTAESIVQALKAKGYLPRQVAENKEITPKANDYAGLYDALKNFDGQLHLHLAKAKELNDELCKDLI